MHRLCALAGATITVGVTVCYASISVDAETQAANANVKAAAVLKCKVQGSLPLTVLRMLMVT